MLHWRKVVSDGIFSLEFLHRCLRKKSSHGYRGSRVGNNEEGEEQLRLFKSKGQHLLTNNRVLDSIVRTSSIKPDDIVLEIGPGTGNLTLKLLEAARRVVAVEIDPRMIDVLRKRAAERGFLERLNIINGDALNVKLPEFNLVVANIPYGISSPLLAKLVYGAKVKPFRSATLLLQKEFSRRLLAKPGDSEFNRLAVNIKLMADVEFVMNVSKRDFVPCPKVDSSVVKIYPKIEVPEVDLNEWWAFTRTCFSKKNKTLGATFKQKRKLMELMKLSEGSSCVDCSSKSSYYDSSSEEDEEVVRDGRHGDLIMGFGIDVSSFRKKIISILECGGYLDKRPSKLSNDNLLQLLFLFNEAGIYFHDRTKPNEACDSS
ncbi:ribosomal RNA small subunit methyltransferase, mitochondrial-like isoform X2 [Andrographis paniculata]|uniref:ribosomal RNA small subunit methyltransferase, mitochondrial-like isoform X2 n=1 Tax=Andrographis paniculata TaxID=175694 RepID=UPI0021E87A1F|nr:ribosomal RNA small subunit methyltransferase, mitochondrial-like isoform X2 [Andrographis paniculata]